jgi:tetratricopeptide (TPR) repeat protein
MATDLTYVTAFYKIYETTNETYVEHFLRLAKAGNKFILFLDPQLQSIAEPLRALSNVHIIETVAFEDLPLTTIKPKASTQLPATRTQAKDTYEYLVLMNSKLEFMMRALPHVTTTNVAWIDFAITKIFTHTERVFKQLNHVVVPENKVLVPGCHSSPRVTDPNTINWRFCGGLFFCTQPTLKTFHALCTEALSQPPPMLTWEVNVWAQIESQKPDFFHWYKADHNDTIVNFPTPKKVIVVLMIKNEERIIRRCIERALTIADAICISDTGSTDNTVKLLCDFLPTLPVPAIVVAHTWKHFGHNRTLSFQAAQNFCAELKWDPTQTYGLLLDADMNFVKTPQFDKSQLMANGYRIIQRSGSLEYSNTRFVNLAHKWTCVGVTHEYWDGDNTEGLDTVYIDDIGDGGCKDDKFQRDERLLKAGLEEDPANARYMFYLAQTLKDLKKLDESISWYKKRVEAGGWFEEVWYSMYQMCRLYAEQNNLVEMEYWGLRSYEFHKQRSENLYYMTQVFRERSQHFKAWHYMQLGKAIPKTHDLLFIENAPYEHLFDYEKTILNYYVQPDKKAENLRDLITYYNRIGGHCYSNLQHYVWPVKHVSIKPLNYAQVGDYVATSTSMLRDTSGYILNIRYVNYRIQWDGSYLMSQDGVLSRDHPVRTRNFSLKVDANFVPNGPMMEMKPDFPSLRDTHIQGLEDLRIYRDTPSSQSLKWVATSKEYSYDGHIKQVSGTYNIATQTLSNPTSLKTLHHSECEKNWIPLGNDTYIYGWYPYRIGKVHEGTLQWTITHQMPRFFEHMRGSSNVVAYNGSLYTLTHVVMYLTPRKYYHQLVKINAESYKPESCTDPFYFINNHIEYCLGIDIKDNQLYTIVSQNDMNPVLIQIDMADLRFIQI